MYIHQSVYRIYNIKTKKLNKKKKKQSQGAAVARAVVAAGEPIFYHIFVFLFIF